jgi:hypothetical protein
MTTPPYLINNIRLTMANLRNVLRQAEGAPDQRRLHLLGEADEIEDELARLLNHYDQTFTRQESARSRA